MHSIRHGLGCLRRVVAADQVLHDFRGELGPRCRSRAIRGGLGGGGASSAAIGIEGHPNVLPTGTYHLAGHGARLLGSRTDATGIPLELVHPLHHVLVMLLVLLKLGWRLRLVVRQLVEVLLILLVDELLVLLLLLLELVLEVDLMLVLDGLHTLLLLQLRGMQRGIKDARPKGRGSTRNGWELRRDLSHRMVSHLGWPVVRRRRVVTSSPGRRALCSSWGGLGRCRRDMIGCVP